MRNLTQNNSEVKDDSLSSLKSKNHSIYPKNIKLNNPKNPFNSKNTIKPFSPQPTRGKSNFNIHDGHETIKAQP